jgi:hypothetical protein
MTNNPVPQNPSGAPASGVPPASKSGVVAGLSSDALPATYCLSFEANVAQTFVGETPGGFRVDFYYSGKPPITVPLGGLLSDELRERLTKSYIKSGSDWATISSQGIIDFDSRITVALGDDQLLIAGRLRGRAQLRDTMKPAPLGGPGGVPDKCAFLPDDKAEDVLARWRSGFEDGSYLPLVLSASFDVPSEGYEKADDEVYDEARALANSLFIGTGRAIFRKAPYGSVQSIKLDLYVIKPSLPSQT